MAVQGSLHRAFKKQNGHNTTIILIMGTSLCLEGTYGYIKVLQFCVNERCEFGSIRIKKSVLGNNQTRKTMTRRC